MAKRAKISIIKRKSKEIVRVPKLMFLLTETLLIDQKNEIGALFKQPCI